MSELSTISVTVPATTANLGPGFDCLGAALSLYNQFVFSLTPVAETQIQAFGTEAERVVCDRTNLAYQAFAHFHQHVGQTPPNIKLEIKLGVPLARGLGSSATAIVGGLVGANWLAGQPLTTSEVLKLAIALEGHPDNVAPALLGGCCLAATGLEADAWEICDLAWAEHLVPIVAIPEFELSTRTARQVLPKACTYADAIFNTAHLGLLVRGLQTGRGDWLQAALQDQLHQPYRQRLIPGYTAVHAAALAAGAHGLVISGAGPTLLALADATKAPTVVAAIQTAWSTAAVTAQVQALQLDSQGAIAIQV
ncbi:MAG: homoserine kinase [Aphanocapsa sp. GSE-SYN-MK-11-07L]|nr:homoserine kinase [Aphanocapsa sp. GSE-SYN-MK-11-07L]